MKFINKLIIIILTLVVLLGFYIINSKQKVNTIKTEEESKANNEKLELEKIKELINKSEDINNYFLITKDDKDTKIKYKEGKFVFEKGNSKIFINYADNSEKAIIITENNKTATKINKENFAKIDTIKNSKENLYLLINNYEKYEINENGEEIFNGYNCISLKVFYKYYTGNGWLDEELKQYNGKTIETKVLIDKNTGIIMKTSSKIEDKEITTEYYYKFNCVTDEEITVPDLSKYKIIEVN